MILWIIFSIVSAATIAFILQPLFRERRVAEREPSHEMAVYRDQLQELEDDRARGLINPEEAKAERVELARRLIREAQDADRVGHEQSLTHLFGFELSSKKLGYGLGALIALASVGVYLIVGQPRMTDVRSARQVRPLEARGKPGETIAELVTKVEQRLRKKPDDGKGWDVVAPVYFNLKRYQDAVLAYERAIALLGESPKRLSGLARSLLRENRGLATARVREAYERLLVLQPDDIEAKLWLARAKEQDGNIKAALAAYQLILKSHPEEDQLKEFIEPRIAALKTEVSGAQSKSTGVQGQDNSQHTGRQPPRAQSIGDLTPQAGGPNVNAMVARLATRLEVDSSDFDGWVRLIRSYMVLGRKDDARQALAKANNVFATDAQKREALRTFAKQIGLSE